MINILSNYFNYFKITVLLEETKGTAGLFWYVDIIEQIMGTNLRLWTLSSDPCDQPLTNRVINPLLYMLVFFFFLLKYLFIYLAVLGVSCSMLDL